MWVPPTKEAALAEVAAAATSAKWLHAFSAGVDYIASFIGASTLAVSNGRSAFSKSLAEYALMAMLHFNKQVPRCQQNRRDKKWDKFTMDVIEGKTVGFVGYGSIAQHTAKELAFSGKSVQEAKPLCEQKLLDDGEAFCYYEPEGLATPRSSPDVECVVALVDQWYLKYGEQQWKEEACASYKLHATS